MFNYIWPIALVVFSNVLYQICAKSVPKDVNPLASLTITYIISTAVCFILFFVLNRGTSIIREYHKLNWAPFVFGIVLVGLEVGWIFAYKAGWPVSKGAIVQSSFLAAILIPVGYFLFKEPVSWNKVVGILICIVGLVVINLK